MIGKSVKESNNRAKFDAWIVSLKRGSQNINKIGKIVLQAGERLILSGGKDVHSRYNINKNFYIISNIIQNQKLSNVKSFIV
ncbi:TrkA C-terminal domain-containing protein, partial [Campylobacter coli]|uniref:TrkA C-terminal domain-containing protein n=1 Tax=Campylobacter coli TaxID=195 RepID=UPI001F090F36